MDLSQLITKIVIFLILIFIGYFCARRGIVTAEFTSQASKIVVNVFGSASIINAVASCQDVSVSTGEALKVFVLMLVVQALSYAFGFIIIKLLRVKGERARDFELLIAMMNILFVGVPIAQEIIGGLSVLYLGIACIPFNFLMYTYCVWRIVGSGAEKVSVKDIISLPMVAAVAAMLLMILRVELPGPVAEFADILSGATVPMSMMVIGTSLGRITLKEAFCDPGVYIVCLFRLIAFPLLIWLALSAMQLDRVVTASAVIMAGCPCAVMVSALFIQYGKNAEFVSKSILVSTVLSMASLPLLSLVLGL